MKIVFLFVTLLILSIFPQDNANPYGAISCSAEVPCVCIYSQGDMCQPDSGWEWNQKCKE